MKSSSNAYMLMYRRRSVGIPEGIVLDSEIPDEIAKAIAKDNKEYNINKAAFARAGYVFTPHFPKKYPELQNS